MTRLSKPPTVRVWRQVIGPISKTTLWWQRISRCSATSCRGTATTMPPRTELCKTRSAAAGAQLNSRCATYPASQSGPIHRRRGPRWISARLSLNGSKTWASALPVHASGSRSDGSYPFTISCRVAAILSETSSLPRGVASLSSARRYSLGRTTCLAS